MPYLNERYVNLGMSQARIFSPNQAGDFIKYAQKSALDKERFVSTLYGFSQNKKISILFSLYSGGCGGPNGVSMGLGVVRLRLTNPQTPSRPHLGPRAPQKTEKTRSVFCF